MSPQTAHEIELFSQLFVAAATLAVHAYAFVRLDRYIKRKGYRSPFRGAGMMLGYIATAIAGVAYDVSQPSSCWSCSVAKNPEYFREELLTAHIGSFALNFVLSTTLLLALVAAVAWRIPLAARRGGPRRPSFPWQVLTWASFVGIPLSLLAGFTSIGWAGAFMLVFVCCGVHSACSYFTKRHAVPPMEQVLAEDGRQPALYLRGFDDEGDLFAMPKTSECIELGIPLRTADSIWQRFTFDEYFATAVDAALGPFVALGSPHDYLPPVGASRVYLEDENWREKFQTLARDSVCILMAPSSSPNLLWELKELLASGHQQKVFILTSPALPGWYGWLTRARHSQQARWQAFATGLAASGVDVGPYPGEGATLGFDAQGVPVLHATSVRTPNDYVAAVQAALPTPVSGERGEPDEVQETPALERVSG